MCAKGPIEPELAGRLGNYETEIRYFFGFISSVRDFLLFPPPFGKRLHGEGIKHFFCILIFLKNYLFLEDLA